MINEDMLMLTKELVNINSVNTTDGEREIGLFMEAYIREIPYFKRHPDQVIVRELKDDPLHRRNVMALLIGEKERKKRTLLFHGHTDTVGIEEYGALKPFACKPDELMEALAGLDLAPEVREDLESGNYLFGRGSCDMKSGDAVFLGILKEMCGQVQNLSGNILVSFNPVEENLHTGIIEGLDILEELKKTYELEYILAINNDFICPLFPDDQIKTLYTGTVGKLLPCFYIQGKETHVGQCFEGFDASMVAAGLVDKINLNSAFSDEYEGEYTYPPSVLKMKDLKPWYNVQTASEALVYFNYFVHNASMEEIIGKLITAAKEVMQEALAKINEMSARFSKLSGQAHKDYEYPYRIMTYEELWQIAKDRGCTEKDLESRILDEMKKGTDKREIPIQTVRYLLHAAGITVPAVILYFAAPYCPHNTLQGKEEEIISRIRKIVQEVSDDTGETFRFMKFFPSLSDSSYLKIDDSEESLGLLTDNFPGMKELYPIPVDQIKRLNIPAVNYGCYGKDAHKWTERVNIPYTFEVLPQLLRKTIAFYLQ